MVVRKGTQARPKRQPVTAVSAAVPLVVAYHEEVRTRADGAQHERQLCLVEVRLEGAHEAPWWLLTDRPVTTAEDATEVFRRYRQRWSIEDACKSGKQCLGWEDVPVRKLDAVRTLVALGWVAAGFLYERGVTLDWPEVRLLTRLGGGEIRAARPPGKLILTRGLRRLLDHRATEAILAAALQQHGQLPPRIAALLGHRTSQCVTSGWQRCVSGVAVRFLVATRLGGGPRRRRRAARAGPRAVAHCRRAWSPAAGTAPATLPARSYPSGRCTWDSARQAAGCAGASPNAARPPCSVAR
jgi:hypothetical protein